MTTDQIVPIEEATIIHGGKATGLRRLMELGFQVPAGFVLSSRGADAALSGNDDMIEKLEQLLKPFENTLAVRSSGVEEDGEYQSFAGIFDSVLSVEPKREAILQALEKVAQSGSSGRAKSYAGQGAITIPVVVQEMADALVSGVSFIETNSSEALYKSYTEWTFGLGDQIVAGSVKPERLIIHSDSSAPKDSSLVSLLNSQAFGPELYRQLKSAFDRISEMESDFGWDIEWSFDQNHALNLLQLRPITSPLPEFSQDEERTAICACPGKGDGMARLIHDDNIGTMQPGGVLVAEVTEVDYLPAMRMASAIVTEQGGLLSHAAIVARELGIPCLVGVDGATSLLQFGKPTKVNAAKLEIWQDGKIVFRGKPRSTLDWAGLSEYDSIIPIYLEDEVIGVEPTLTANSFYSTAKLESMKLDINEAFPFANLENRPAKVNEESEKLVWMFEWRRFDKLRSLHIARNPLEVALARWSEPELSLALSHFEGCALRIKLFPSSSALEALLKGELGASYHALIGSFIEGRMTKAAYRDSANYRYHNGISFADFLSSEIDGLPKLEGQILRYMRKAEYARNWVFPFFRKHQLFDENYFSNRYLLVQQAAGYLGLTYEDELRSLDEIYAHSAFLELDDNFAQSLNSAKMNCD